MGNGQRRELFQMKGTWASHGSNRRRTTAGHELVICQSLRDTTRNPTKRQAKGATLPFTRIVETDL